MTNYAAILATAPVHFWELNETSGTSAADSGSSPVAGVYAGGYTQNQAAISKYGQSSDVSTNFDGSSALVTVATSPNWTSLTACAWFKATSVYSGVLLSYVYGPNPLPINITQDASLFGGTSGRMAVGCYTGSAWNYVQDGGYAAGDSMFIVGTVVSGGNVVMWKNGKKIGTAACGAFTPPTTSSIRIGRRWDNPNFANGLMAGVAMWNRVLTDTEILSLFTGPPPTAMDDVVSEAFGSQPSPWLAWGETLVTTGPSTGGGAPPTTGQLWPRGNLT